MFILPRPESESGEGREQSLPLPFYPRSNALSSFVGSSSPNMTGTLVPIILPREQATEAFVSLQSLKGVCPRERPTRGTVEVSEQLANLDTQAVNLGLSHVE
tara:strand:- start:1455 stop:1760 length:306 start_codon:yes stop_codon:yes gene_type:complete